MDLIEAIHERRTVKEYEPDPVPRELLGELLELARWAPVHRLTEPWRFRIIGPAAYERLCEAAGAGADKLARAPTLVVASYVPSPLPLHAEEDAHAAACAVYAVLLGARARGLASYWRTPGVLRTDEGRAAVQLPDEERVLGLVHLGWPRGGTWPAAPERRDVGEYATWLD